MQNTIIKQALALSNEFFHSNQEHYGPGFDLITGLLLYVTTGNRDELFEYGALVTHLIDNVDVPIETFCFSDRNNNPFES